MAIRLNETPKYRQTAFSYVEMVFVVAMLAVMASVATPYLQKNMQRQKELELRQNLREIRTALDAYKAAYDAGKIANTVGESGYPKTLQALVYGVEDVTDPKKRKIKFLRRIPADPMYVRHSLDKNKRIDPEETWATRSYDSSADAPQAGEDVYDVYSRSEATGLNGVPYAQW